MAEAEDVPGSEPDDGRLEDWEADELETLTEKDEDELTDAEATSKIKLSVKRRFDYPTWLLAFEFQNRDGRRADAIAMSTVASRNFPIVGFEFKASRADWLEEKKNHEKADRFVQLCDEWYVVAGRRGIVEEEELPDGWGLLELKPSSRLYKIVESDLSPVQDAKPDRQFFLKFIKKTVDDETRFTVEDLKEAEKRGYEKAVDEGVEQEADYKIKQLERKAERWEQVKDNDLGFISTYSEVQVERLKLAFRIAKIVDGEDFNSLINDAEHLQDRLESRFESMHSSAEDLEDGLRRLHELLDDEPLPMEGDD